MRFKVFYFVICVFLLSSCAVSSFSNRTTSKSLYQRTHFKKPTGFKISNSKNEHTEKFLTGNSILNFSKELAVVQDSIFAAKNDSGITKLRMNEFYNYHNENRQIHIFKTLSNPPKDSTYIDPELSKNVKMTHIKAIIGTIFAHLGLGLSIFGLAALLNMIIGTFILLALLGIVFSFVGLLLSIDTMKELRRYKNYSRIYFLFAIISLVFSIMGIIVSLGCLFLLIILAFSGL